MVESGNRLRMDDRWGPVGPGNNLPSKKMKRDDLTWESWNEIVMVMRERDREDLAALKGLQLH